ncbi:ABC transporter substrate-binding protein [bacterium]|nr:ABC transporter substrate-binding protein [bacterium]
MRRRLGPALLISLVALANCSDPAAVDPPAAADPPAATTAAAAHPQHLVTATIADPQTFNPIVASDAASRAAIADVFDTLVRFDPRSGEIEPALAERWSLDEGGRALTMWLRGDVRWHDGEPLTARDVIFTFDAIRNPAVPNPLDAALTVGGKRIEARALDDHRVRFSVERPFAPLLSALAVPIVPEHVLGPALRDGSFAQQWRTHDTARTVVGSGPYRLERYEPGRLIHLVRNDAYWRRDEQGAPLPYLAEQTIRLVTDQATATRTFLAGEIDLHTPAADEVRALLAAQGAGQFAVHELGVDPGMLFVAFNRNPAHYRQNGAVDPRLTWFTDPLFLRALAHAVNKRAMIDEALDGFGMPAVSFISPANPRYANPDLVDYAYDLARASALLDEGGYIDRDGDGVREDRAGHPIELTLTTNTGNRVREQIAAILRRDWHDGLRLDVHVETHELDDVLERLRATFDWDAMLMGFTGSPEPNDAASLLRSSGALHVWFPNQPQPATDWEAEIDRLVDAGARSLDPEQRRQAYWRIQEILVERLPIIQTVRPLRYSASTNALENYEPTVWGVYRPERIRFIE